MACLLCSLWHHLVIAEVGMFGVTIDHQMAPQFANVDTRE